MPDIPDEAAPRMTPGQLVTLLDTAMRSRDPIGYLDAVLSRFEMMERSSDAAIAREMATLFADGEIERLLRLRAEWRRVGS